MLCNALSCVVMRYDVYKQAQVGFILILQPVMVLMVLIVVMVLFVLMVLI